MFASRILHLSHNIIIASNYRIFQTLSYIHSIKNHRGCQSSGSQTKKESCPAGLFAHGRERCRTCAPASHNRDDGADAHACSPLKIKQIKILVILQRIIRIIQIHYRYIFFALRMQRPGPCSVFIQRSRLVRRIICRILRRIIRIVLFIVIFIVIRVILCLVILIRMAVHIVHIIYLVYVI